MMEVFLAPGYVWAAIEASRGNSNFGWQMQIESTVC
ncbi:hypothetical protein ANO14919_107530 [Xylariales sp. No.14919]|nr:hypothetical protein ANO14919_107530 [Xylariales sp. No.14919]